MNSRIVLALHAVHKPSLTHRSIHTYPLIHKVVFLNKGHGLFLLMLLQQVYKVVSQQL